MRTLFLLSLLMKLFLAGAPGLSRAEMSLPVMSPTSDVISGCDYCDSSFTGITLMTISDIQEWRGGRWRVVCGSFVTQVRDDILEWAEYVSGILWVFQ